MIYNIADIDAKIQSIAELCGNVSYLNNRSVKINYKNQDYVFIGSTLWSDIDDQTSKSLNDYNSIFIEGRLITASDIRKLFQVNKQFIGAEIKKYDKNTKVIVMTHHLPSFHFLSDSSKNYEKGYASELEYLLQSPVVLWISGHDHNANKILQIGNGTTFAINCLGYPGQRTIYSRNGISI